MFTYLISNVLSEVLQDNLVSPVQKELSFGKPKQKYHHIKKLNKEEKSDNDLEITSLL